jgi:hypothetical protein
MPAGAKRLKRNTDCVAREVAGETIIVPIRANVGDLDSVYTLSEVGSRIWQLLDGHTTIAGLAAAICAEYDVSPEQAEADTLALLADLQAAGLICPVKAAGEPPAEA